MKVLLQRDVPHLGKAGEVKEVKEGFARNYLIPQKLAVPATAAALQGEAQRRRKQVHAIDVERKKNEERAGLLKHLTLTLKENATPEGKLYGGIHREAIVHALKEKGIMIETQSIILSEPLKTIGSHQVEIHLKFGFKSSVSVNIIAQN